MEWVWRTCDEEGCGKGVRKEWAVYIASSKYQYSDAIEMVNKSADVDLDDSMTTFPRTLIATRFYCEAFDHEKSMGKAVVWTSRRNSKKLS